MSRSLHPGSGLRAALRYWQEQRQRPWLAALLQTLIVGGTAIAGIVLLSSAAQRLLLDDLRRSLGHAAAAIALQIDGDAHERLIAAGKATPAEYEEAVRPLRALVRTNPDLRYAYTGILRGNTMYYVVDADTNNPSDFLEVDSDPPLPGERAVWDNQRLTVEDGPTATPWVVGIRAYAPVFNRQGRMVAYVAVTMRAQRYQAEVGRLRSAAVAGLVVTMLLALVSGVSMWHAQHGRNQALQAAVAAAAAKREFLATMSHEIRTPLNGILGLNELLLNSHLLPQQRQWVASAQASGQHLLGVVNDILDFSRIEAGRLELDVVEFSLADLIKDTLEMFALPAEKKGLQLLSEFAPDERGAPRLQGDPFRLRQVLSNLIGNAIKFTDKGRIVVRASHRKAADGRIAITLCVADTGIGIAPDAQDKIFEHFLQADGSTTRRYGGTGLGLAISRRLVQKMGGTIRLESTAGFGSRFYVELELPAAAPAVDPPQALKDPAAGMMTQAPLQGTVLLVEDNPINQMVATAMLEKLGLAVTLADDGRAAIEKVRTGRFDLVLMDCQMPVMDGYEATAAIRADASRHQPRLHIIAVTANTMPGDDAKCRAAGMDDVLAKPFSLQQLRAVLERWLPPPVQRRGDTAAKASA